MIVMWILSIQSAAAVDIAVHPGDSIQSAVDKASNGDNIIVYGNNKTPYTYKENIFINKKLNIKSSGSVTIESKNTSQAVFTVNNNGAGSSIQNFNMTKSNYCIVINNANNCLISGNNIIGASLVGIQFYGNMNNSKVFNNKITGANPSVGNGISFEYGLATFNNLTGNSISNFLNGILFNNKSTYNTVSNNQINCTGFHGAGIYATDDSKFMRITGNIVTGAEDGIAVQQMGTNTASNYFIDGNTLKANKNGFWILLNNSTISNNNASMNNVSGLDITGQYNLILDNTACYNGNCGITLTGTGNTDYNTVDGNILSYNIAGVNSASQYTTFSNNVISYNTNNGLISTANYVNIICNKIINNNGSGILDIGTNSFIKNNLISYNDLGICLQKATDADYNTVSNNNITNNNNGINSESSYTNFIGNNINFNNINGLVNNANHVIMDSNVIKTNMGTGLLSIGIYNTVINSIITGNNLGICLQKAADADYNLVKNNNLSCNINGINSQSSYTTFFNNSINYSTQNGLTNNANHVTMDTNTILGNKETGILSIGTWNLINNNKITYNNLGICMQKATDADNNTVSINNVNYNTNGINSGSTYSLFKKNNFNYNNQTGIIVTGIGCNIVGNSMSHNKVAGLTITSTGNNVIQNNICYNLYGASFNNINAAIFNFNSVIGNTYQLYGPTVTNGALNALNNWWGLNCAPTKIYGSFDVSQWLVLKLTTVKSQIIGTKSNVTVDLTHNSAGLDTSQSGHVKDGTTITLSSLLGSITSKICTINGTATGIYNAIVVGNAKITANIDSQSIAKYISTLPVIKSVNLEKNAVNVSITKIISLTYNMPIKFGKNVCIELKNSAGKIINIKQSINSNILTIVHSTLSKGTKYTLIIHTGSITDLNNRQLPLYSISFTTAK